MLRKTTDSCHIGVLVSKKTSEITGLYAVANLFAWVSSHKYLESLLSSHDHGPCDSRCRDTGERPLLLLL